MVFLVLLASTIGAGAVGPDAVSNVELLPVRLEKGIVYGSHSGEAVKMDLAIPKEGGPYPAVVMLHGGAWQGGSRSDLSRGEKDAAGRPTTSAIETIASHGYVVASVGYRLAPKYQFPAQIEDARTAIRFIRAKADKYHLDPKEVAAVGFSAGGHLALLLALAGKSAAFDGTEYPEESDRVACAVSFFGPTDLSLYAASPGIEEAYMVPLLGKMCKTDPAVYARASPISYVSKTAPPILMIHGTADLIVPIIHSERLLEKLRAAGAAADLVVVKGEGHGWGGRVAAKTTRDAIQFLDANLKGKK